MTMPFDEQDYIPSQWGKEALKLCKSVGQGVITHHLVQMVKQEMIEIGDYTRIENFVFINGGAGLKLGKKNHISWFISVIGGGQLVTGDYVSFGAGARIINGTDHYRGGKIISPLVPMECRGVYRCHIEIQRHAFIGSNAVIVPSIHHPDIVIGEGAIVGANSLVTSDIEPWTINVGSPCQFTGKMRPKLTVPEL